MTNTITISCPKGLWKKFKKETENASKELRKHMRSKVDYVKDNKLKEKVDKLEEEKNSYKEKMKQKEQEIEEIEGKLRKKKSRAERIEDFKKNQEVIERAEGVVENGYEVDACVKSLQREEDIDITATEFQKIVEEVKNEN